MNSFPMAASSSPDLGVIRPDKCASVTDSGARANDVVDKATQTIMGLYCWENRKNIRPITVPSKDAWNPTVPRSIPSSRKSRELVQTPRP